MTSNTPEPITIAIPFYKGQAYLRSAIESVRRQSSPNWRLIVCDDGAESGTSDLVASLGDSRIHYFRNERNLGMAGNWNRCLTTADTDLVNLLHNDDELLPNYVEIMLAASRAHPEAAAFFCRAKVIDARGLQSFSFVDSVKRVSAAQVERPAASGGTVRGGGARCAATSSCAPPSVIAAAGCRPSASAPNGEWFWTWTSLHAYSWWAGR